MRATFENTYQVGLAMLDYYQTVFLPTMENPAASFAEHTRDVDMTWDGKRTATATDDEGFKMLSPVVKQLWGEEVRTMTEEGSGTFQTPGAFDNLVQTKVWCDTGAVAFIDPTDGNSAFVKYVNDKLAGNTPAKRPPVAVMVTLVEEGQETAACILTDDGEAVKLVMAVKDQGAHWIDTMSAGHETTKVTFSPPPAGTTPVVMTTLGAWNLESQANIKAGMQSGKIEKFPHEPKSAGHETMSGVEGETNVIIWRKNGHHDQGSAFVLKEMGWVVRTFNGFNVQDAPYCDGVIAAATQELHDTVREVTVGEGDVYVTSYGPKEIDSGLIETNAQMKGRLETAVREKKLTLG